MYVYVNIGLKEVVEAEVVEAESIYVMYVYVKISIFKLALIIQIQLHEDLVRVELDIQHVCARCHVRDVDPRTV